MGVKEIKKKIAELDARQDDESISDEEFYRIADEIAQLYLLLAQAEKREAEAKIRVIRKVSPWYAKFLSSFKIGLRKVTNQQAYYIGQVNHYRPFIYDGKIYECTGPNYRVGFGMLEVRKINREGETT